MSAAKQMNSDSQGLVKDLLEAANALDKGSLWFANGSKVRHAARIVEAAEAVMAVAATGQIVRLRPAEEYPDELTNLGFALSNSDYIDIENEGSF